MTKIVTRTSPLQHAKKVVSDIPGLVDFAVGLVNSVLTLCNLPDGKVKYFGAINLPLLIFFLFVLVEMTFGLRSLPKWQAVKLTFFAPCIATNYSVHCKFPLGSHGNLTGFKESVPFQLFMFYIYNHMISYSGIVGLKQTAFSYIIFIFGLRLHFIARSLRFCTHVHEWSNFEKENKKLHPV